MKKTNKIHKIKTLRDIVACVNNENAKFFIQDFVSWLEMTIAIKELAKNSSNLDDDFLLTQEDFCEFQWINDGKKRLHIET